MYLILCNFNYCFLLLSINRCIFDAYVLRGKPETDDVITIDSEEEEDEIELTDTNIDINHWYSDLLKSLERQYPLNFEKITKEVMRSADKNGTKSISKSKRRSLKTVLGKSTHKMYLF